jgi:hypothetical protein
MPNFTYWPAPKTRKEFQRTAFSFTAGEWTRIPDDRVAVEKLRGNRFFAEQRTVTNGEAVVNYDQIRCPSPAEAQPAKEENGTEVHDSGSGFGTVRARARERRLGAEVTQGCGVEGERRDHCEEAEHVHRRALST